MATPMAEEQKNVATDPEERFIDNTVEPLDAMVDDDNSKVVGSAQKVVGSSSWTVSQSNGFTYKEKAAALLLVRDAYRSHRSVNYALVKKISQEMKKEFGDNWNVVGGSGYTRFFYTNKYIELDLGSTQVGCFKQC